MDISQKQVDELMRVVRWRLRSFRERPDWDDILAVAYLGMWTDIVRCQHHPRFNLKSVGVQGAVWEALSYVRKAKRIQDNECQFIEYDFDESECLMPLCLTDPDPAPRIVDQIHTEKLLRCLTDIERDVLIRYHVEGMTFLEIATAYGKNSKTWGFNNVRAAEKKVRLSAQVSPSSCR